MSQKGVWILIPYKRHVSTALSSFCGSPILKIPEVSHSVQFHIQLIAGSNSLFLGAPDFQELIFLPFIVLAASINSRSWMWQLLERKTSMYQSVALAVE